MLKQKNEDLQKKYLELQIIIQQINEIQQQLPNIQNQVLELRSLKENITSLKEIKENTESFTPIGYNIFTKAKLQNTNGLLVNVGANIFVIKTVEEAKELIDTQIEEIQNIIKELENKLVGLENSGQVIQSEILRDTNK